MKYPIKSREGSPIITIDNAAIPLHGIKEILDLSSQDEHIRLCNKLGIDFLADELILSFKEQGNKYENPEEDRNLISNHITEDCFNLKFKSENSKEKLPLKIQINLDECSSQEIVNFLGEINFRNSRNENISIPLTGRGTAALEGRINDAHASLCTSAKAASFQERVAVLSSILANFELTRDDIEIFRAHLLKICNIYFGIENVLSYTIDKAFGLTNLSYFDYMRELFCDKPEIEIPIMLSHFIEFGEPHPTYFYELTLHFSEEEIENELKKISSHSLGPDKKPISSKVREIVNKFILSEYLYLIKPYPVKIQSNDEKEEIDLNIIAQEFNSANIERILKILEKLGVTVSDDMVKVSFFEKGYKYIYQTDNIFISDTISEDEFQLDLKRLTKSFDNLLKLKLILDINPIDNINFLGKIQITESFFKKIIVPLAGRGTINVEGSVNDKYMGFCMGNKSASFLQRVSIIYCSLVLMGVDKKDLQMFTAKIRSFNSNYHGKHKIVDYIFRVVNEEEKDSYFYFMCKTNMNYSTMPIVLKTILTYNRLPNQYYEDIISKFTEEELIIEDQRFEKSQTSNILSKAVSRVRSFVENMNIF